ncbi:MAG: HIT family protein [Clostridia bacterium]|nr:HIT family protein [Clostridia bacterium]
MKDCNCGYCMRGELLDKFGIIICDLKVSTLILFKEQSHKGRCIVAYKDHVSEIVNISKEERELFIEDINNAANAIHKAFGPKKVNYGAYGDTGCHLHFHLVPKYEDDEFEWGSTFAMNPNRVYLEDEEYKAIIEKIKSNIEN